ncbi:MAG: hypothetical protein JWO12_1939 [Frankiales bacterium]|nr:hypothetical protein [Frankiales bacterium]
MFRHSTAISPAEVVIVCFGYDDRGPLPLSAEQRERLQQHLLL